MKHYARYRGEPILVIGHHPLRNDCLVIRLSKLSARQKIDLQSIVSSRVAQETDYLIPILRNQMACHDDWLSHLRNALSILDQREDWFSYICKNARSRNAPIFRLPMIEIEDTLDPDQKVAFLSDDCSSIERRNILTLIDKYFGMPIKSWVK
jgi:hypothetical protein